VGEARLGLIDGVVATKAGWIGKIEVVEVVFDPETITYKALVKRAVKEECAARVFSRSDAQQELAKGIVDERAIRSDAEIRADDDKFYTSRTVLKHVPMTPLQATHVNAWVGDHEDPTSMLAPGQLRLLEAIQRSPESGWPVAIGVAFLDAWKAARAHEEAKEPPAEAD